MRQDYDLTSLQISSRLQAHKATQSAAEQSEAGMLCRAGGDLRMGFTHVGKARQKMRVDKQ